MMRVRMRMVGVIAFVLLVFGSEVRGQSCSYTNISCSQQISGRLENSGCKFTNSSKPFAGFLFNAYAGQVLDIFLESDNFPPLVAIYEPNNSNALMFDDGLSIAYIRFDVQRSGTYRILAAANNSAISGLYRLSVYCQTVCKAPFIDSPTVNTTVPFGGQTTINVNADGTPPLSYRWFNESNPSTTLGTTAGVFTTPPLFTTSIFGVDVSNACGTATRHTIAIVNVAQCVTPAITSQPQSISSKAGVFLSLTVVASGNDLKYQWYRGAPGDTSRPVPYLGTGSSTYSLIADAAAEGPYWVRVSNSCGSADSQAANVQIDALRRRAVRK